MASPNARPQNLPNTDITKDDEGNQYIRHSIRPVAPVTFYGRLGSDIELEEVSHDKKRATFTLARDWQDYGQDERTVGWLRVTAWNGAAEVLAKTKKKGDPLLLTTERITTLIVCDKKGRVQLTEAGLPRIIIEVTVDNFELAGGSRRNGRNASLNVEDDEEDYSEEENGDEIPF